MDETPLFWIASRHPDLAHARCIHCRRPLQLALRMTGMAAMRLREVVQYAQSGHGAHLACVSLVSAADTDALLVLDSSTLAR